MQSLVDLPLLELPHNLHIFLADLVIFEVVELGGIVREVQQVDLSLVFLVELVDVLLDIEVIAASHNHY